MYLYKSESYNSCILDF